MEGRVNTSRYAVLGLLSLGPQSGYDIKKLIEGSIAHFWSESFGQIYPVLRRLEGEGFAARRSERQAGKPDRQIYSLTPRGLAELQAWLVRPARAEAFRNELLLKLFLGARVSVADSVRQVEQFRAAQAQLLRTYAGIEQEVVRQHPGHPDLPYWRLTLGYGRRKTAALVGWADDALRVLGQVQRRRPRPAASRGADAHRSAAGVIGVPPRTSVKSQKRTESQEGRTAARGHRRKR